MVLDEQSWYVVRHTPGVTGFVGAGSLPLPLSEREVRDLMARIGVDQVKPKIELDLKLGDTVCVKSGAFAGQTGPVVELIPVLVPFLLKSNFPALFLRSVRV